MNHRPNTLRFDIHRYEKKFVYAEQTVRRSGLSARNQALILQYRDACLLKNVCGRVRLIRVMGALVVLGAMFDKEFDRATRADVERVVGQLVRRDPPYSAETLGAYKAILRSFLTWVAAPDEFPTRRYAPSVAWLNCHVRARDKKRLSRHDLLTPDDVEALIAHSSNPRDRALIAVLWETGGRIAEIGNLQLKHLTKHQHGYTIEVNGKTGTRSPLIIDSAPYLTAWLNQHPFADNGEHPVWVHYHHSTTPLHLKYDTLRNLLQRAFQRAGINKPWNPHAFRHARATWLLAKGIFTEQQAKMYFGWSPNSEQLATYAHLVDGDANIALLRERHLAPHTPTEDRTPTACRTCGALNPARTVVCPSCGTVASQHNAVQQANLVPDDALKQVLRLLLDRTTTADTLQLIHDAGLAPTLQRLAKDHPREGPRG
jgi:integrase